jgi:hypothetical protein
MEKIEEKSFFVKIDNYYEIKKEILESSKEILICLKKYETIEKIKLEKKNEIQTLLNLLLEIDNLSSSLEYNIPIIDSKVKFEHKEETKEEKIEKKMESNSTKIKKNIESINSKEEDKEIDEIEDSIKELEKKINGIVN